jgi:hypothetical protein
VSLPETAKIIGVSQATVSRLRKKFLTGKRADLKWKSGWGGLRRGNLSEREEGKFIKKWNSAAEKGNIKTLDAVHLENVPEHSPQESVADSCYSFSF